MSYSLPIHDPEEARLQRRFDDARERLEPWIRRNPPNPDRHVLLKLADGEPITTEADLLEAIEGLDGQHTVWEDFNRCLYELRVYRARNRNVVSGRSVGQV